jgi:hypothetical protein
VGVERFLAEKMPFLRRLDTPIIVNVAGGDGGRFHVVTSALDVAGGVSAIEVNLACPNVAGGGAAFRRCGRCVRRREGGKRDYWSTVIAKVTPSLVDVASLAQICESAGATRSVRFGAVWGWRSISTHADRNWAPTSAAPWEDQVSNHCTCVSPSRQPQPPDPGCRMWRHLRLAGRGQYLLAGAAPCR